MRLVSLIQTYSVRDYSLVAQLGRLRSLQVLQGQEEQPVKKKSQLNFNLKPDGINTVHHHAIYIAGSSTSMRKIITSTIMS